MSPKTKPPTSFAIINGRKVSLETGKPLDGLANSSGPKASSLAQHLDLTPQKPSDPAKPLPLHPKKISSAPRKSLDMSQPARKRPPHVEAKAVHRRTHKPVTKKIQPIAIDVQKPAAPAMDAMSIKKKPQFENKPDYDLHRIPQSARLSEARLQRAASYRQSNVISKFGRNGHPLEEPVNDTEKEELKIKPDFNSASTDDLKTLVQSVQQRQTLINQRIAEHHRRHSQNYVDDNEQTQTPKTSLAQRVNNFLASKRTISATASILSVAVLIGYVAYLNAPSIAFRVAASRAGITAKLPGYTPSGFAMDNPVQYDEGRVVLSFRSASDNRGYRLTQQESMWDSRSLLENYVREKAQDFETIEQGGLTIYVYNGSNATWVSEGLRYTLEGASLLEADQITKIASSL